MRILSLRIRDLRCFEEVSLVPCSRLNVLVGDNGAGKSSVLEGLSLLSGGKSFRGSRAEYLIRRGAEEAQVFAEVEVGGVVHRLGFGRSRVGWSARLDGGELRRLSDLARCCAVLVFEPNALDLLSGPSESRRRFIDWLVFHVEHTYSDLWIRYQRILNQRNALLKQPNFSALILDSWDPQLALIGEGMHLHRAMVAERVAKALSETSRELAPELGDPILKYRKGWEGDRLLDALRETRVRDRQQRFTGCGPHRSDWRLSFGNEGGRHELSRGQQKTACFMLVLALMRVYQQHNHCYPIVCLDDLCSELDVRHQDRSLRIVEETGAQIWVTGTRWPRLGPTAAEPSRAMFHVERHAIQPCSAPIPERET